MTTAADVLRLALSAARSHPYGWLVSAGQDHPTARLVQHLTVSEDAVLQVGTSPQSRKAREVRRSSWASYAVEDRAAFAYATFSGPCTVVDDAAERAAAWADGLEAFFPDGPAGDDFVLLRLAAERIELMDFTSGVHPDPYGLRPEVVQRSAGGWASE